MGTNNLMLLDRSGKEIRKIDAGDLREFSVSRDWQRIAFTRVSGFSATRSIWLLDIARRDLLTKFTFGDSDQAPTWSPDGNHVVYLSSDKGAFALKTKSTMGNGPEELIASSAESKSPTDWWGRFVLYRNLDPAKATYDLMAVPVDGDRKPFPVVQTPYDERDAQFSPDGKWIAYQSNKSGQTEIYVQPFPGPGRDAQISNNGGERVRWRRDGKELIYVDPVGRLVAVPIKFDSAKGSFETDAPVALLPARLTARGDGARTQYDVSADGQQFIVNTFAEYRQRRWPTDHRHPELETATVTKRFSYSKVIVCVCCSCSAQTVVNSAVYLSR